jgi:heat shock protein HslJ
LYSETENENAHEWRKQDMKAWTLIAAALAALALMTAVAGCSPQASGNAQVSVSLDGTAWTLIRLHGEDLIPETQATLEFEGDQIAGTASCNRYFGSVTIEDEAFTVGTVGSTEMWCAEPQGVMEQEQAYLQALTAVARYSVEQDELTLYGANGQAVLAFAPAPD